ncbi:MaoC family dehydratase [Halococcus saccharolyticus]|uniref:Acyl dehydratase MaoC n=1 Tax=Halococcus saccharolyticus DSM 5350 TaxID=1227455 RepID=M0MEJ5_9EURY|nr:MaoC family dehydratase [Halococcus saccharolyticus]EMA42835.1 acyl dehydratase MaoC [Halococcus saccharolyticus DSM 5350]
MSSGSRHDTFADAWLRGSTRFLESVFEANRAALAAFGGREIDETSTEAALAGEKHPEWEVNLTERRRDALSVGDRVRFAKSITDADVRAFARASGDTNPLHLDETFAERTRFGGRIAHGTLASGLISAALARLPGLVVYLSQDVEFQNPVRVGDRVTADCEIVEDLGDHRYRIATQVTTDDATAIDGEAVVLLDEADP